jgi:hypothetical protein
MIKEVEILKMYLKNIFLNSNDKRKEKNSKFIVVIFKQFQKQFIPTSFFQAIHEVCIVL